MDEKQKIQGTIRKVQPKMSIDEKLMIHNKVRFFE